MPEHTLEDIEGIFENINRFVRDELILPEPALQLDIRSRNKDKNRIFKYLHQQCTLHVEHFIRSQQIKSAYIVSGYIKEAKEMNPIGVFLFSRTILELTAFIYEVQKRLKEIKSEGRNHWQPKGEQFFSIVVRARYATSDRNKEEVLSNCDVSRSKIKPFNIMNCLKSLAEDNTCADLANKYDELCDYVHHNLSSHTTSVSGHIEKDTVLHQSGGGMQSPQKGPHAVYNFPSTVKAIQAIDTTLDFIYANCKALFELINNFPRSPYTREEVIEYTGNYLGLRVQKIPANSTKPIYELTGKINIGPNELCPCGSLIKYKKCCSNTNKLKPNN